MKTERKNLKPRMKQIKANSGVENKKMLKAEQAYKWLENADTSGLESAKPKLYNRIVKKQIRTDKRVKK